MMMVQLDPYISKRTMVQLQADGDGEARPLHLQEHDAGTVPPLPIQEDDDGASSPHLFKKMTIVQLYLRLSDDDGAIPPLKNDGRAS